VRFDLLACDRPTTIRIAACGQQAEEFIEAIRAERSLLADFYIREIVVPDSFRRLAFGEKDQFLDLARRSRQPHLHHVWVTRQYLAPLAPRRPVTFVYDDMAEIIFGIILCQEIV